MGRIGSSGAAALDFTDGDTSKRFTITDAIVQQSSRVSPTIQKNTTADVDDSGWIYIPNVLAVGNGSFDVKVTAISEDAIAASGEYPNEVITLTYIVD